MRNEPGCSDYIENVHLPASRIHADFRHREKALRRMYRYEKSIEISGERLVLAIGFLIDLRAALPCFARRELNAAPL